MNGNFDPMRIIQMIKQGQNPQQLMLQFLEGNMAYTPFGANILQLAKENRTSEIEQIARNICASKGLDFDSEFRAFRNNLKL